MLRIAFCSPVRGHLLRVDVGAATPGALCSRWGVRPLRAARGNLRTCVVRRWMPRCSATETAAGRSFKVGVISVLLFVNAILWALIVYPMMMMVYLFGKMTQRKMLDVQISLMQFWMRLTIRSSFLRVKVDNRQTQLLPESKRVLYICNHQSALDVFVSAFLLRRVRYLMPSQAFSVPLIGWMMGLAQWIPVNLKERRGQIEAIRNAGEALKDSSLVVFPEVTPNTGVIKEFPSTVFRAAQMAGVVVAPVTIHGTGDMSEGELGIPSRRPSDGITVTVHEPIESGFDVKEIARLAFMAVRSALPKRLWSM